MMNRRAFGAAVAGLFGAAATPGTASPAEQPGSPALSLSKAGASRTQVFVVRWRDYPALLTSLMQRVGSSPGQWQDMEARVEGEGGLTTGPDGRPAYRRAIVTVKTVPATGSGDLYYANVLCRAAS